MKAVRNDHWQRGFLATARLSCFFVIYSVSDLSDERAQPDGDEDDVAVESVEDVSLSVNLASVNLVKQSHHDERVEDHCEVLCRLRVMFALSSTVDVQKHVTYTTPHTNTYWW